MRRSAKDKKKIKVIIIAILIFATFAIVGQRVLVRPPTQGSDAELTQALVTRVIDGDTLELETGERIRLIGVDAPESNEEGGAEATAFVTQLVLDRTVWLEADGNDTDVHGRLRRYVWLTEPSDAQDEAQIRQYMLNARLLIEGHAEVMIIGNVRHEQLFRELSE